MVPELVELVKPQPRAKLRGRDFSRTSYRAPATVKKLTKAYNEPPPKSWWGRWWGLVIFGSVVLCLAMAAVSPIFEIRNVIINNAASQESESRLRALVQASLSAKRFVIFPQTSLVFISTERLAGTLSGEVADINVNFDRHWPNVLRITLPPNVFVATWHAKDKTFVLDTRGVLAQTLSEAGSMLALTPVNEMGDTGRSLGDQVATPELALFLQKFNTSWAANFPDLRLNYLEVDAPNLPTLRAVTGNGWYATVSSASEVDLQLAALKRLLAEKIKTDEAKLEYIDVRFGSKLYYKLKP